MCKEPQPFANLCTLKTEWDSVQQLCARGAGTHITEVTFLSHALNTNNNKRAEGYFNYACEQEPSLVQGFLRSTPLEFHECVHESGLSTALQQTSKSRLGFLLCVNPSRSANCPHFPQFWNKTTETHFALRFYLCSHIPFSAITWE